MKSPDELTIRAAREGDVDDILTLLIDADLNIDGVHEHLGSFVVAVDADQVVACVGAEAYQFVALVRSLAVLPEYQGRGLGRRLVRQVLDRFSSRGLREFYVVTEDAEGFFKKRGFKPCDRDEVHPQVLGSSELTNASDSAVVMRLQMLS
ncbi:MAG: GNAT family N-acetyltransferase [Thermoanaerobaculia bacterium]|jgi:N-acetylglutamate synthase-like GNAT family acetyltransferase